MHVENVVDTDGNPTGGMVRKTGLWVVWQDGPLGRGKDRKSPNGAFVEDVIKAAMQRLRFFQEASNGKFACKENGQAIVHLEHALNELNNRRLRRELQGVEGTFEV